MLNYSSDQLFKFTDQPINVVYHYADFGDYAREVAKEQLGILAKSGIKNLYINYLGVDVGFIRELANSLGLNAFVFSVNSSLDLCEIPAMDFVDFLADHSPLPIMYFHSKGVSHPEDVGRKRHRDLMNRELVAKWEANCVFAHDQDAVGVNLVTCEGDSWVSRLSWKRPHFCGNFWIARASYINSLPPFTAFHAELKSRMSAELWIGTNPKAKLVSILCSEQPFWRTDYNWDGLEPPRKLNLGCGSHYVEGWVNYDFDPQFKADDHADVSILPSVSRDSVGEIFAGHVVGYLDSLSDALARWYEVLIPGGTLTVSTTDMAKVVNLWKAGESFDFLPEGAGITLALTGHDTPELCAASGSVSQKRSLDEDALRVYLKAAGFIAIKRVESHPAAFASDQQVRWQTTLQCKKPHRG
jgi:hypothetical protein